MYGKHLWLLIIFFPTVIAGLMGLRARLKDNSDAWADYNDTLTVLDWFTVPMVVVTIPLMLGHKFTELSATLAGVSAILSFYVVASVFTQETRLTQKLRLKQFLHASSAGIGITLYIIYCIITGSTELLVPSANLYINIIWVSVLAGVAASFIPSKEYKQGLLGPGELSDRIKEIAKQGGASIDKVIIVKNSPDCPKCINAVAIESSIIAIFEDLIKSLKRAEVDAVIEHEVGHAADERIWTLDSSLRYGCYLLLLAAIYISERHIKALQAPWQNILYAMWVGFWILPEIVSRWYSRRDERRANENVGHLTEPISAISGYYKLALLDNQPISRPLWSQLISTHPCISETVALIGKRAGLPAWQLEQLYKQAKEEILHPNSDVYETVLVDDEEMPENKLDDLVKRPSGFERAKVTILAYIGGIAFLAGGIYLACILPDESTVWIPAVAGFLGCILIIVITITMADRARGRRLRQKISDKLVSRYGQDAVSKSLLVDALTEEWIENDQPWQGALLDVSANGLTVMGEASEIRIHTNEGLNVHRWADSGSSGSDARMVRITYKEDIQVRTVMVRVLGHPEKGEPANWKQLEKELKRRLTDAGANCVSMKELLAVKPGKLKWSSRIPVAAGIYLVILTLSDYLARELAGNDWDNRIVWGVFSTMISGSGLWAWVTHSQNQDSDD